MEIPLVGPTKPFLGRWRLKFGVRAKKTLIMLVSKNTVAAVE